MTAAGDLEPLVGRVLDGRYRLDALLGQGGMGAVFRAYHLAMERKVAVKVLRPHLVGDPIAARRFAREAKGTFKVGSDHAVKVHDFAIDQSSTPIAYMVMEYLDGRTVSAELAVDGPFAPARTIHVMRQVCDALAAAHRLGLVHRDIKPDNIMLSVRGSDADFAKVLDFGLAKLADNASAAPFSQAAITQGDMVFGTPDYMSPEQAKGQPLDGRSDLYAVGVTMFEMLTGRCPFVEPTAILMLARHVQAPPPRLADVAPELASVPGFGALEALVARLLAKAPHDRPASAEACIAELDACARAIAARGGVRDERSAASTMDLDAPPARPSAARAARREVPSILLPASEGVPRARRRGVGLLLGAAGVAVIGGVIVAATTRGTHPVVAADAHLTLARDPAPIVVDAGAPPPSIDASITAPAPPSHIAPVVGARTTPPAAAPSPQAAEIAAHVTAAEAARTAGNRLKQLAEADLALRKDPRNTEARFLLGDALIATGDVENGCRYLRAVKRLAKARAAASAAGCPVD